jgi:hypothetical protein
MRQGAYKQVVYLFLLNKIYLLFLIWLSGTTTIPAQAGVKGIPVFLEAFIQWDAGWYLKIARYGYDFTSAPFFPMLPFLIYLLTFITGNGVTAGLLISNTAHLIACILLYRLVEKDYHPEIAVLSVLVLLFFPTAVFFSSVYSESLFLAFALGAFFCARREKWLAASLTGACAALTRNVGIVIFLALLYLQYQQQGYPYRLNLKKALPLLLIPASLLIFMGALCIYTGDPLAFTHSLDTEIWGYRHFKYPGAGQLLNLKYFFNNYNYHSLFEAVMALSFLLLLAISFKYIKDRSFLIFAVAGFLIPFSSVVNNVPHGMPRYIIVLFPVYITLACLLQKNKLVIPYSVITVFLFTVVSIMFFYGRWIS